MPLGRTFQTLRENITDQNHQHFFCISTKEPQFDSTKITENVWEKSSFWKTAHGLLCTPDLVYCFFEFISYTFQRESVKYINSGRISWL